MHLKIVDEILDFLKFYVMIDSIKIMNNIYKGPVIKLVGKVILTAVVYAAAHGVAIRLWR